MSDIAYRLIVDMSTRGNLVPAMGAMESKAKGLDSQFKAVGASLSSGLGAAASSLERMGDKAVGVASTVAKIGAVGAGAGIAYGVVHLNNALEKTQISLGAIFNAQGVASGMPHGMRLAADTIKEMRRDAAMLPGEFGDLLSFFKLGATPGFQAGATISQLEKMSAMGMAAAAATGVQMDQAAREFAQLLQGRAGSHNVFGALIGFSGEDAKKFNAMSGENRLKELEKALKKYESSIEVYGGSFDALTSTMIDNGKQVLQRATAPLFDRMKGQLVESSKWFDNHEDQVMRFADRVGGQLVYGFDLAHDKVVEWTPAIKAFGEHAITEFERIRRYAEPILKRLESLGKTAIADPQLFKHLEKAALLYGGVKVGKAAAPVAGGLFSALGGLAGPGGLGALGVGAAELAAALPIAGAAVGVFALAAEGAVNALANSQSKYHEQAVAASDYVVDRSKALGEEMLRLDGNTRDLRDAMGTAAIYIGGAFVDSASQWTTFANDMIEAGEKFVKWVNDSLVDGREAAFLSQFNDKYDRERAASEAATSAQIADYANGLYKGFVKSMGDDASKNEEKTKKGAGGGGGGTSIQKVEIVVSSNQDPSRIARLTVDRLLDVSRFPTSSPKVRNWSAERP